MRWPKSSHNILIKSSWMHNIAERLLPNVPWIIPFNKFQNHNSLGYASRLQVFLLYFCLVGPFHFFLFLLNFIEFWKPIFLLMSLWFLFWHFRKMARFLNAKLFHISTPLYMLDWLFRNFYLLTSKITTLYSSQYHNIYEEKQNLDNN